MSRSRRSTPCGQSKAAQVGGVGVDGGWGGLGMWYARGLAGPGDAVGRGVELIHEIDRLLRRPKLHLRQLPPLSSRRTLVQQNRAREGGDVVDVGAPCPGDAVGAGGEAERAERAVALDRRAEAGVKALEVRRGRVPPQPSPADLRGGRCRAELGGVEDGGGVGGGGIDEERVDEELAPDVDHHGGRVARRRGVPALGGNIRQAVRLLGSGWIDDSPGLGDGGVVGEIDAWRPLAREDDAVVERLGGRGARRERHHHGHHGHHYVTYLLPQASRPSVDQRRVGWGWAAGPGGEWGSRCTQPAVDVRPAAGRARARSPGRARIDPRCRRTCRRVEAAPDERQLAADAAGPPEAVARGAASPRGPASARYRYRRARPRRHAWITYRTVRVNQTSDR
eukprot:SAG22_NODE_1046_length_5865_cov_4.719910_9_plen_394_part_00